MLTYYANGSTCKRNQGDRRCATSARTHVSLCTSMRARVRTHVCVHALAFGHKHACAWMFRTFYRPNFFCMLTYYAKGSTCKKNQGDRRCATSSRTHVTRMRARVTHVTRMRARVRTRVRACMCTDSQRVTCVRADVSCTPPIALILCACVCLSIIGQYAK